MAPMIVQSNVGSNDNTSLYRCQHIRELIAILKNPVNNHQQ